ncbi:MAG: hypothetical protein ACI9XB_005420, partial [Gammaproteobacteria bacterium]
VWDEVTIFLETNPGLQVKTIFKELQKCHPGKFQDGQRRTLERNIRLWKAIKGEDKEVYFEQNHYPGNLCASDYTKMNRAKITIKGKLFHHMLYHFVMTYSNWETATICYSETYESLNEGLQNALFELGGVPNKHRSDNLSAAVINMGNDKGEMTKRYNGLMDHYKMERSKIQPGKPNENGDVEKSNDLLKKAIDQQLMLRGSRDFESIEEYEAFLRMLLKQLNSGRSERLKEELACLKSLPQKKLDCATKFSVTVSKYSTIRIKNQVYSVWSRLMGLKIEALQGPTEIAIRFQGVLIDTIPRAIGGQAQINYRHIISSLVRKPGAFEDYKYNAYMFPTSNFREAYDNLQARVPKKAIKEYLKILKHAADFSETDVDSTLRTILDQGEDVSLYAVSSEITNPLRKMPADIQICMPNLNIYDQLIRRSA